jgi:hypothetical protein
MGPPDDVFYCNISLQTKKGTEEKTIQGESSWKKSNFSIMPAPDETGFEPGGGWVFRDIITMPPLFR